MKLKLLHYILLMMERIKGDEDKDEAKASSLYSVDDSHKLVSSSNRSTPENKQEKVKGDKDKDYVKDSPSSSVDDSHKSVSPSNTSTPEKEEEKKKGDEVEASPLYSVDDSNKS
eukprot:14538542-Ditylum_brightwellii.AAC.1